MTRFTAQRPLGGERTRAANRILGSSYRRASIMAHAGLAIVAAPALLISSAPAMAACVSATRITYCSDVAPAGVTYKNKDSGGVDATVTGTLSSITLADVGNYLNNLGVITQSITTGAGLDILANAGTIRGEIDLGAGLNSFYNNAGGIVEATRIDVGAGNYITNSGTFSPGGYDTVATTTMTGIFLQFSNGTYLATLAGPASADRVDITGNATLAGSVVINRTGAIGNTGSIAIMTSGGTLTNNGVSVTQNGWQYAVSRLAGSSGGTTYYRYDLNNHGQYVVATASTPGDGTNYSTRLYVSDGFGGYTITSLTVLPTTGDQLVLSWNRLNLASYVGSVSLTDQQRNVVNILAAAESGNAKIRKVNDSLLDSTIATVQSSIGKLTPAVYVADVNSWWQANNAFMQSVNSCPTFGVNPGFIQEGQCYWAKFGGRHSDWNTTATNIGGQDQAFNFSGGVQVALRDEWRLGFAGLYETSTIRTPTDVRTESDRIEGAIVLKNRWDRLSVSATAFAGYTWADTERTLFGTLGTAESEHNSWLAGSNLRVSQLFELPGRWYVKPMVDLNATHIGTESFTEHGADGANLTVQGDGYWVLAASPAIEIGTEITSKGIIYRPYVRAGGTFLNDATFDVTASFAELPGQVFTSSQEFADKYVDISAGVDILTADGVDLKLTYDGRFASESSELSLGAKAAIPF